MKINNNYIRSWLRNLIAANFRLIPYFRGKWYLGRILGHWLTNSNSDRDSITIITMKDGSPIQLDVRSRTEQWSYWTGEYDDQTILKLAEGLPYQPTILDIGANIGIYSVGLGNKLKQENCIIHAFEPVKSNFERLISNVALNHLEKFIIAHNIALGEEEGEIEISLENDDNAKTGNAVMVKGGISREYFGTYCKCRLTKLDTFVREQQINSCDFIKIDIEGAEVMFLQGAVSFLSQQRPIIYGEFNHFFMQQFGHSFLDVLEIVTPWKYRFFKQGDRGDFIEITQPQVGLENILLIPSEKVEIFLKKLI
jgi:FkbM family methyltransferase